MAPTAPQLTLRITNADVLPDGGPLYYVSQGQNFQIGRNSAMHWVLPNPRISAEHLRVVWRAGRYWLQDISSNGTFLNGQTTRMPGEHPVEHNDQFVIGPYIILATLAEAPTPWQEIGRTAGGLGWNEASERTTVPRPPADIWAIDRAQPESPGSTQQHFAQPTPLGTPFGQQPGNPASPAPPPVKSPLPPVSLGDGGALAVLDAICRGAGLPPGSLSAQDPERMGEELGRCLRISAEQMIALLAGRAKAKTALKSRNRTMMGAQGNNPLKFVPDATSALQALFVQRATYYLPAAEAFSEGFEDIKRHEMAVFAAMQRALARLVEDLSPESIESRVSGGAFSSRKAQAWALFTERWDAKTHPYENGMLDVFLAYFSEAYDATAEKPQGGKR